jgi:hypothetical protein
VSGGVLLLLRCFRIHHLNSKFFPGVVPIRPV